VKGEFYQRQTPAARRACRSCVASAQRRRGGGEEPVALRPRFSPGVLCIMWRGHGRGWYCRCQARNGADACASSFRENERELQSDLLGLPILPCCQRCCSWARFLGVVNGVGQDADPWGRRSNHLARSATLRSRVIPRGPAPPRGRPPRRSAAAHPSRSTRTPGGVGSAQRRAAR
jgi:hypothetical protein